MTHHDSILTLACADRIGIVHAVAGFLFENSCNILDSAQFGDDESRMFFMRVHFDRAADLTHDEVQARFAPVAERFAMRWTMHDAQRRMRALLMVSRFGHCLNDLLYRVQSETLPIDVRAIASNHADFAPLAASYGIAFHHLPIGAGADAKPAQEVQVLDLVEREHVDLVVLARYMQVLSTPMCERLSGRAINIHHSFLPSFKGARPYAQAHARGVKLIGATAHYVTADLDEGPIIEQDVERVDHAMDAASLEAVGRDIEAVVLARAVKWHAEHRILLNGHKTVVFK